MDKKEKLQADIQTMEGILDSMRARAKSGIELNREVFGKFENRLRDIHMRIKGIKEALSKEKSEIMKLKIQ